MLSKGVLELLEKHKSIRKFTKKEISNEIKEKLEKAFILSPTAQGLQACSMIEIDDENIKEELANISNQKYVKDAKLIYIFVADFYKLMNIKESNEDLGINHLLQANTDALISAQSVYLLAEELGLTGFYSAGILQNTEKLIEILKLPKYCYPMIGLCLGYADEEAMKKPRLDKKYRIFKNHYNIYENYNKEFKIYDEQLDKYIDNRNKEKSIGKFTDIIKNKFNINRKSIKDMKDQGFSL